MRNFLALVGAVVMIFATVGWFKGWFAVTNNSDGNGGQSFNIAIQTEKIRSDLREGKEKVEGLLNSPSDEIYGPPLPPDYEIPRPELEGPPLPSEYQSSLPELIGPPLPADYEGRFGDPRRR